MKVVLIDDEPIALDVLQIMLESYKNIEILACYTNPFHALDNIDKIKPEIIFLDIEMGDINGLELAEIFMGKLENVEIVFVTAYSEYAVDAFEINAIDYLLKPIQERRLRKAIKRLEENSHNNYRQSKKKETTCEDLRVLSFGGFEVSSSNGEELTWRTQKSKELFAYLWTRRKQSVYRDKIIEDVFPNRDLEKAITLLHTTIYQLRKSLEKLGYPNSITYSNESYKLNIPITSDLKQLDLLIGLKKYSYKDMELVLNIYKGDFLEEGYHWAIGKQQEYRTLVFKTLKKFIQEEIKKNRSSLILKACLDRAYEINPLSEEIAQGIIRYYGEENKICSLEKFYKEHIERLEEEINLQPVKDTVNMYNKYMESF